MAKRKILTAARLRELLHYDDRTGGFYWAGKCRGSRYKVGTAGADGYVRIGIFGRKYLAHRLAWLWMTGEWPRLDIDHINRKPADNRWLNLREATRSQNNRNNNRAAPGVSWNSERGKWLVRFHVGSFASKAEAMRISKMLRKDWRQIVDRRLQHMSAGPD